MISIYFNCFAIHTFTRYLVFKWHLFERKRFEKKQSKLYICVIHNKNKNGRY
jgi:hypothetical protein